jgi:membrane-associated PAP2 superfamily phosphatase
VLGAGIAAGLLLGIGRIARGAHFLSHVLWSGLVCWLVMVCLYGMLTDRRGPEHVA